MSLLKAVGPSDINLVTLSYTSFATQKIIVFLRNQMKRRHNCRDDMQGNLGIAAAQDQWFSKERLYKV